MIKRVATLSGGFDGYGKAFLDVILTCKFAQAWRSQVSVGIAFVKRTSLRRNYALIIHISNSRFIIDSIAALKNDVIFFRLVRLLYSVILEAEG